MLPKKISCLVCCYSISDHYDLLLERALNSIANNSILPTEVILVLNACHDRTINIANKFYDSFINYNIITKAMKNGLANAKNFGLKFCTGDYVCY